MKQYKEFKKQHLRILLWVFVVFALPLFFAYAQNAQELKSRITNTSSDINEIQSKINSFLSDLEELSGQKDSLSKSIKELDLTRKKLNADITLTQKKVDRKNLEIESLNGDIGDKESSIINNMLVIGKTLKHMNEMEEENILINAILSENDFTTLWNELDQMLTLREELQEEITHLRNVRGELIDTVSATVAAKKELTDLKSRLADQKKIVDANVSEKNNLLKKTKNSESNYQKLIKEETAKRVALEQELQDYESQLQYILDPNKLPVGNVLSWPLEKIYVTQMFGRTVAAKRLYASGSHSGVDFRASVGTPVMAMADGVVKGVGDTDTTCRKASFGGWIFIEYDNGLASTYGHTSLSKVKVGQRVSRGEVVGYSGATGRVTGPHLHVTVYAPGAAEVKTFPSKSCVGKTLTQPMAARNAYLDPMIYLPPYKK